MHVWIQSAIDILIIVMASILVLFTLGLIVLHILTTTNNKRMARIKQHILRMLSVSQDLEYLRGKIHQLLEKDGETTSLKEIRGIRSNHGIIAMTVVAEESSPEQQLRLRSMILRDQWYIAHIHKQMGSRNPDKVGLFTKLIAEMRLPDFEPDIMNELHRWPSRADNQEIALLALFRCGCEKELISLFGDPSFRLVISFRALQELFAIYNGDETSFCRSLLEMDCDSYITRACIRSVGIHESKELCAAVEPFLSSENTNLVIDAIRTLGMLHYRGAAEAIRGFTSHPAWIVRSVAATALFQTAPDDCYDDLLRCLCDREWWVRFHAAEALGDMPDHPHLMEDVKAMNDRFAFEMMRFILERNALLKEGRAS